MTSGSTSACLAEIAPEVHPVHYVDQLAIFWYVGGISSTKRTRESSCPAVPEQRGSGAPVHEAEMQWAPVWHSLAYTRSQGLTAGSVARRETGTAMASCAYASQWRPCWFSWPSPRPFALLSAATPPSAQSRWRPGFSCCSACCQRPEPPSPRRG